MRVLVTAGTVYGRLDDNKLVGNRVRGIWACKFAGFLASRGHAVTLLVPDTMPWRVMGEMIGVQSDIAITRNGYLRGAPGSVEVMWHKGFDDYRAQCCELAKTHDAAVLAAAVVNWIPKVPYPGKMVTKGFKVGDVIDVPFILAPRVIEEMKGWNPNLTLIGCKMLIDSVGDELLDAAYDVLLKSRCATVIANDMGHGLKRKLLVGKDRSVREFNDDFDAFFRALAEIVEDVYFKTARWSAPANLWGECKDARRTFDRIVDRHRADFTPVEGGRVFGAIAVSVPLNGWLVSGREKGEGFNSNDATVVSMVNYEKREVRVPHEWLKPTLNAPLLIRYGAHFMHSAVVHFHKQIPGLPTVPYAQPGTVRDNEREFTEEMRDGFNIEGHGCVLPWAE